MSKVPEVLLFRARTLYILSLSPSTGVYGGPKWLFAGEISVNLGSF